MGETSKAYKALWDELAAKSENGDELAIRCQCAMSLLIEGWRYGDPDLADPPDGDGGHLIDLDAYRRKLAA